MKSLVLDTNILLIDANNLLTLGRDRIIILPETVLDEMDVKKTDLKPELRYQSREFARIYSHATIVDVDKNRERAIVTRIYDGITIKSISLSAYPEFNDSEVSIRNDRKILTVAKYLADSGEDITFMSNDVMCRERAIVLGIDAVDLKLVEIHEDVFTKILDIPSELFSRMHNLSILEVDSEYVLANYNYCFNDIDTGQVKLANIRNGLIDILGKDTEQELRRQDINPMNVGQLFLSRAIQNPNVDIVVCEALAGSGKTLSAFSNGIRLVKKGEFDGIVYLRTSVDDVDKAEEIGFLSGNDEKYAVYFHPVDDILEDIAVSRYKESKLKGKEYQEFIAKQKEDMIDKYNIQKMIGLGLRGRTIKKKYVIIDEAQNMSRASFQKAITRFGEGCKIVVIGSNKQIDNPYITKHTNGLSVLLDACTEVHDNIRLHVVPLTKVLRSNIAEFGEKIFSKDK